MCVFLLLLLLLSSETQILSIASLHDGLLYMAIPHRRATCVIGSPYTALPKDLYEGSWDLIMLKFFLFLISAHGRLFEQAAVFQTREKRLTR